jgi:hypothetical protein
MNAGYLVLLAAGLAAAAPPARATIYKCLLDNGGVFYQDAPCAPGRELRDFDKEPANVSVLPFATSPSPAGGGTATRAPGRTTSRTRPSKPEPRSSARGEHRSKASAERAGDARQRRFLRPGMSEGEVIARVGRPDMTSTRKGKGRRWTYMPVTEDPGTITYLDFDNGRLTDVERKVIK